MSHWKHCHNILCIRPDNMGDLLMSGPAIRALKKTFNARITVLTSSMAAGIAGFMPEIDEVIVFDMPWVRTERPADNTAVEQIISRLRQMNFDAAVIFTVFSQNPLPSAMLAYQACIPRILGYCRENPYGLLTDWIPDEEPYTRMRHQVERDIHLVSAVGARTGEQRMKLIIPEHAWPSVQTKLQNLGWDNDGPWLLLHPGVSELKRRYPTERWIEAGRILVENGFRIILTGTDAEKPLTSEICRSTGPRSYDAAGLFALDELICLINHCEMLISVNTGTVHIAAALSKPVVVLYAQTNPQHTPWRVENQVLEFPVPATLHSQNEVLRHLQRTIYKKPAPMPTAETVLKAVRGLSRLAVPSALPSV